MSYRPNLVGLVEGKDKKNKNKHKDDDDSGGYRQSSSSSSSSELYVAPRRSAAMYEEEELEMEKQQRLDKKLKEKIEKNKLLHELRNEFSDKPELRKGACCWCVL